MTADVTPRSTTLHLELPGLVARIRRSRLASAGVVVAIAAAGAVASSLPLPRGPVTPVGGLAVMATSVVIGVGAGWLMRSRLAVVLAPAAYVVGYELTRIGGIGGATFGPVRLDTSYGIVAFIAGRGVHWLLALVPMLAGVALGRALAGSRRRRSFVPACLLGAAAAALAVLVATPGSTPPVVDATGAPIAGSIAELTTVNLNGRDQALSIRAANPASPVLLYLSGGPGQSDIAFARALLEPLTTDFVVVVWDQRGSGKSYPALEPVSTFTLDGAVDDTVALVEHLRARFGEQKVYLLGESWGSTLGVLAVQRRPDLFHAYIGSGQMVSQRITDQVIWRDLLVDAEARADWARYDRLVTMGEPPYADVPWSYSEVMGQYVFLESPYTPSAAYIARGEASGIGMFGLGGREYSFLENANLLRGLVDTFSVMYPQLQAIDFRKDVTSVAVPVYILDGEHELRGRRALALEWFDRLEAPSKRLITYADAGHAVGFEQVDALQRLLRDEVVPSTYPGSSGS